MNVASLEIFKANIHTLMEQWAENYGNWRKLNPW